MRLGLQELCRVLTERHSIRRLERAQRPELPRQPSKFRFWASLLHVFDGEGIDQGQRRPGTAKASDKVKAD